MAFLPAKLEDHLAGMPPEALDRPCIDGHLKELALRLTDRQEIGMFLDLDEGEMEDIECSVRQVRARSLTMLRKWSQVAHIATTHIFLIMGDNCKRNVQSVFSLDH